MNNPSQKAQAGLNVGAAAAGATASIGSALGIAAGAAQAVPIAGQAIGAALAIASALTAVFAGNGPRAKRKEQAEAAKRFQLEQRKKLEQMTTSLANPKPMGEAPSEQGQGYGAFQQMQESAPIFSSWEPQPQPGYYK